MKVDALYYQVNELFYDNIKVLKNDVLLKNYLLRWVKMGYSDENIRGYFEEALIQRHKDATDTGLSQRNPDYKYELVSTLTLADTRLEASKEGQELKSKEHFYNTKKGDNKMNENNAETKINRHEEIDKKVDEFMEKNTQTVERWRDLPKEDLVRKLCLHVINKNECAWSLQNAMYRNLGVSRPIKKEAREGIIKSESNNQAKGIKVA